MLSAKHDPTIRIGSSGDKVSSLVGISISVLNFTFVSFYVILLL